MLHGRQRDEWSRFAQLSAILANQNRKKGAKGVSADDMNPVALAERRAAQEAAVARAAGVGRPKAPGALERFMAERRKKTQKGS
jgi:hypothetical protein